jgi:hypothetical protein
MTRGFSLRLAVFLCLTAIAVMPLRASTITLDGTMSLVWQYDLTTNSFNTVAPLTVNVHVTIDDQVTGRLVFSPQTIRTYFGSVEIDSPLFNLLGFDTSTLIETGSGSSAQGNNSTNDTWLTFSEDLRANTFSEERLIEFGSPPMTDPANFTSADLDADLLQIAASGQWGMRDDGGGLQNLLSGSLTSITIDNATPEPSYSLLAGVLIAAAATISHRRTFHKG